MADKGQRHKKKQSAVDEPPISGGKQTQAERAPLKQVLECVLYDIKKNREQ